MSEPHPPFDSQDILEIPTVESPLSESISCMDRAIEEHSAGEAELVRLLQIIAIASNESSSFEDVIQVTIDRICDLTRWPVGHGFLVSGDFDELFPTRIWHLEEPAARFEAFRAVSEAVKIPRGSGLVGQVLATGKPQWISDVTHALSFPRADMTPDALGVKAGYAFPVLIGKDVVAVLEFFSTEVVPPDERWMRIIANIGAQLGRVAERVRAAQFQDRITGIMAHDLRNPLQVIGLSARFVLDSHCLSGRELAAVERIAAVAARMDRIILNVMDYSRARRGHGIPLAREPCSFDLLCRQVLLELEASHPSRVILYDSEGEGSGSWDGARIHQMLENLLINALKHGQRDTPIQLRWRSQNGHLFVSVHNLGPPIPEGLLPYVFEPFRCGDPSSINTGLGLGLYIVKEIVRAHEGTVSVQSTEDAGTTFVVRLPMWPTG